MHTIPVFSVFFRTLVSHNVDPVFAIGCTQIPDTASRTFSSSNKASVRISSAWTPALCRGLPYSRVRGTILIKQEWLDAYLESFRVEDSNQLDKMVDEVLRSFGR